MIVFNNLNEILHAHIDDAVIAASGRDTEISKAMEKIFTSSSVQEVAERFKKFENQWYRHEFAHFVAAKLPELYTIKDSELFFQGVRICRTDFSMKEDKSELEFLRGVKMNH